MKRLEEHSFDVSVKLRVRGIREPVHAKLLHIALSGCRLRSWMLMERGAGLSFQWRLSDGKLLDICGVVATRYPPRSGGVGFEYAIALEELSTADADALSREAAMLARRTACARSYDTSLVDISQFTGYRVAGDFPLAYRTDDPRSVQKPAQACDVSGNGLRMRCAQTLGTDEVLILQFTLPEHILRKYLRRAFGELRLKARVLGLVKDSRGRDAYELQFIDLGGMAREELARYIHASQLANLKR